MNKVEYGKACTEVVTVLENMPKKYFEKVPYEKICFYRYKMDINYEYNYDPKYKNLSIYALAILMNLYRDYWTTEEKNKQISSKENKERKTIEAHKREKYNAYNMFEKKQKQNSNINVNTMKKSNSTELIKYKESILKKVINKIKHFFHI